MGGGWQRKGEGWRGAGFNRTNAHGGHTSRQDTVTFTCIGDDHGGVVTLFSKNNDHHHHKDNNKRRGSTSKRTGVFHSWQLGREPHRQRHSFDLTVFKPPSPTRQQHGNKHIRLSAREVLPKGRRSPIISLLHWFISFLRGDNAWKDMKKEKKKERCLCSCLCSFVSTSGLSSLWT